MIMTNLISSWCYLHLSVFSQRESIRRSILFYRYYEQRVAKMTFNYQSRVHNG